MKKPRFRRIVLFLALPAVFSLFFTACTDFFSTSLGSWAARDWSGKTIPVNSDNVHDLIAQAENDPDMSLAVLRGIEDAVSKASGKDKTDLQSAALEAATNASGIGNEIIGNVGDILKASDEDDNGKISAIINSTIDSLGNLGETSDILVRILPDPDTDPAGFQAFLDNSAAEDLGMAAVILLAAESKNNGGADEYLENGFDPANPKNDNEKMALALAQGVGDKIGAGTGSDGEKALRDILEELGLL
ncbi:hypothetical protein [Breznakiella homolactica]|uniref:Lipoprotein n=1 Tax=Breznakiella homolactica TaxID=2798577 RepID=A0A7T8B7U8_9SPIR|nr:hypothetical protein [Breznakiella homolactica]QQO07909.1 hypothetical protein JFL75_13285 [Breznakiella homolactica]